MVDILEEIFWRRCYQRVNNRLVIWFNLLRWRLQKTGDGERFRKKIRGVFDVNVNMDLIIKMYYIIIIVMGVDILLAQIWKVAVWIMPNLNSTAPSQIAPYQPYIIPLLSYCLNLLI